MPRRPRSLDPRSGPLDVFALELRALRDRMGPTAPTPDQISKQQSIGRSTIYAALNGSQVPTIDVLAALVTSWGGAPKEWTAKRTKLLSQLEANRMLERATPRTSELSPADEELVIPFGVNLFERIELRPDNLVNPHDPEPDSLKTFRAQLDQVRTNASMSYTQLERRARSLGLPLPRRSAHALIQGEVRLDWSRVEAFVRAATVTEDVDAVVDRWRVRWNLLISRLAASSIYEIPGY